MTHTRNGSLIEVDIHGMTSDDAKRQLEQFLTRLPADVTEVCIVHGYNGGRILADMVRKRLKHPRVQAKLLSLNPGQTRLLIQEAPLKKR